MRDWAYEASHGRFRLHRDPFDYEAALSRLRTPRLMLGIDRDHLINPGAVALLAKRAANAARLQVRVAGNAPVDHFLVGPPRPGRGGRAHRPVADHPQPPLTVANSPAPL
ncbi:hypothetical protein [Paractinoplanes hotanensis]|uniref:Uncharacterized protein n=1 Tax=Paractinoplanes hotanensis TaxID=2906497 RepID=A0ABT0XS74_9ACTN|nr:hypothetical protein [Actinoplanes hotanensis]MCM4076009.1 hypothetical protein [Actinoplanes hotanensis]